MIARGRRSRDARRRPSVSGRIVSTASIEWIAYEVAAAPDNHFRTRPNCGVIVTRVRNGFCGRPGVVGAGGRRGDGRQLINVTVFFNRRRRDFASL